MDHVMQGIIQLIDAKEAMKIYPNEISRRKSMNDSCPVTTCRLLQSSARDACNLDKQNIVPSRRASLPFRCATFLSSALS